MEKIDSLDSLKDQLRHAIDQLDDWESQVALEFITFLLMRQSWRKDTNGQTSEETDADLLWSRYIGGVEHGSLAQNLDEELYGFETLHRHMGLGRTPRQE